MQKGLYISELSRQSGVPARTVRYYEQIGLLDQPVRTETRYRLYDTRHLERLRFIGQSKALGLSLEQIRQIIELRRSGVTPCESLKELVSQQISDLTSRIARLSALRDDLVKRYEAMQGAVPEGSVCGIIETQRLPEPRSGQD